MQRYVSGSVIAITAVTAATLIIVTYFYNRKKKNQPPKIWKPVGVVTKLHLYPLKSGRRIELKKAKCHEFGIQQHEDDQKLIQLRDRCFVIYGEDNEVKTARTFPKMVLIEVSVHDESHVAFDAPGMRSLYVKFPTRGKSQEASLVLHQIERLFTLDCGTEAASWVSRYIKDETSGLRLGYHDGSPNHKRDLVKFYKLDGKTYEHLRNESAGVYSDLTAVLLINQSSVDELNTRLTSTNVTVEHFRPAITIAGDLALPYSEDDWDWIKIGDTIMRNVKPCTRCIFTTIDPDVGVLDKNLEPLRTLRTYRLLKDPKQLALEPNSPVMGINLEINKKGDIAVNDVVYIG